MDHQPIHYIDIDTLPEQPAPRAQWIAELLIPRWLEAEIVPTDVPAASPGTYDFEVRYEAGRRGALEVRSCSDATAIAFENATRKHGSRVPGHGLSRRWELRFREETQVRELADVVVPILRSIESMEITAFAAPQPPLSPDYYVVHHGDEAERTADPPFPLRELHETHGVETAWSFELPQGGPPVVDILRRSLHAGNRSEHLVTAEVESAAAEKIGVLSSPRALTCDERHLFVWLGTEYCFEVEVALWTGYCGEALPPELPTPITHAWVAGWSLTPGHGLGHVIAWRAEMGGQWEVVE